MIKDKVGNIYYESNDLIKIAYEHGIETWDQLEIIEDDSIVEYNSFSDELYLNKINTIELNDNKEVQEKDKHYQNEWFYDDKYKNIDILDFCLKKCNNELETERVKIEYTKFKKHNMIHILKYALYFVENVKNNKKIILGVGRGSAVSSFILYLIGIHRINPIIHELDINEFFKE